MVTNKESDTRTTAMLQIQPDDVNLTWQGAISLQHTVQWIMPWRIPYASRDLFPPEALQERAAMAPGVRLTFLLPEVQTLLEDAGFTVEVHQPFERPLERLRLVIATRESQGPAMNWPMPVGEILI